MSTLKKLLCTIPLLCAASAAGFALGRADVRAPAPPPCDLVPFTWPLVLANAQHTLLYPVPKYLGATCRDSVGIIGGVSCPEGQSWHAMPASPNNKLYNTWSMLLRDGRVLLNGGSAPSIEPSPPASPSDR